MKTLLSVVTALTCLGLDIVPMRQPPVLAQSALATCTRLFEDAVSRMERGEMDGAYKDFGEVISTCSSVSELVAEARLRRGEILFVQRDTVGAKSVLLLMPQQYVQRPSFAAGLNILNGRIKLTENRSSDGLILARDDFNRAEQQAPGGSARNAEAVYYSAETLRLAHQAQRGPCPLPRSRIAEP